MWHVESPHEKAPFRVIRRGLFGTGLLRPALGQRGSGGISEQGMASLVRPLVEVFRVSEFRLIRGYHFWLFRGDKRPRGPRRTFDSLAPNRSQSWSGRSPPIGVPTACLSAGIPVHSMEGGRINR